MRVLLLIPLLALAVTALAADGELLRLTDELDRRAAKGQWRGVERAYDEILALQATPDARIHVLAAQAAAQRGDATTALRRYLQAERLASGSSGGALERYRTEYGPIDVRRVEADCIRLAPAERPFDPSKAAAITFAAEQLASTGAYQGLLPVGSYQVGPHRADIRSGAAPTTVQRIAGDGDCR